MANGGYARIVVKLEKGLITLTLRLEQFSKLGICINSHGPKFEHVEELSIETHTFLLVEHWPWARKFHQTSDNAQCRRNQDQDEQRTNDVEKPLGERPTISKVWRLNVNERETSDGARMDARPTHANNAGGDNKLMTFRVKGPTDLFDRLRAERIRATNDEMAGSSSFEAFQNRNLLRQIPHL